MLEKKECNLAFTSKLDIAKERFTHAEKLRTENRERYISYTRISAKG